MAQDVGRPVDRRRRVVPNLIGALTLAAALVASIPASSESARPQATNWPRSITMGTAAPGGAQGAYGEGLARILTRTLRIDVTAQVTQGPAQNIVLMEKREAMLGFVTHGRCVARVERSRL